MVVASQLCEMVAKKAGMTGVICTVPHENCSGQLFLRSAKYQIDPTSPSAVDPTAELGPGTIERLSKVWDEPAKVVLRRRAEEAAKRVVSAGGKKMNFVGGPGGKAGAECQL